jgi:hypothetical protein
MDDKLLAAFAAVDWISPLLAMLGNVINGPSYTFLIPYDCGWSGREIISLLKRHGIKSWGHMVVSNTLMLTVRQAQAEWAHYVLDRAAIPMENPMPDASAPVSRHLSHMGNESEPERGLAGMIKELWNTELF